MWGRRALCRPLARGRVWGSQKPHGPITKPPHRGAVPWPPPATPRPRRRRYRRRWWRKISSLRRQAAVCWPPLPPPPLSTSLAGVATDWLLMLGMLGVGLAVMLGIGLRVAAVSGALIMAMMWLAEWPLIQGSTNPLIDYHVIYGLVLILCAVLLAGDTW